MARARTAGRLSRQNALGALVVAALLAPGAAHSQRAEGGQPHLRLDAIAARAPSLQLGAGANWPTGLYVRIEGTAAVGTALVNDRMRAAGRADVVARFLLDPFAESRLGVYGVGGASLMYDERDQWRPRLVLGMGVEGRPRNGRATALEIALGGGIRVGVVVRCARSSGR